MLSEDDYKELIANVLYKKGLIDEEVYEKCGKPKYISDLPGDLRSTDTDELQDRLDTIDSEISRRQDILKKADYRIGVKTRDVERLEKRVDKHYNNIEKAETNIAKDSDKIVKNIEALETKLNKVGEGTEGALSAVDRLKKAHNNLFSKDVTKDNSKTYDDAIIRLKDAGDNLQSILSDIYDNGLINKSDLKKGDISKMMDRVQKNKDKIVKGYNDIDKDGTRMLDNAKDIEYIAKQSLKVQEEMDKLNDEYDATLKVYLESGGRKSKVKEKPSNYSNSYAIMMDNIIDEMHRLRAYYDFGVKNFRAGMMLKSLFYF